MFDGEKIKAVGCEMSERLRKHRSVLVCVFLALATIAVYWPTVHHEFVKYDDDKYVTENPNVTGGISKQSVIWAFTGVHYHMWHPLTTLSHILDCQLFGLDSFRHHLVNILFHTVNVLLLFGVLKTATGAVWPSAFVAAVFALHPVNVESVAWVAERKNVLSGLFWLLTMAAYIRYAKRPAVMNYLLVFLVFALAVMTKPVVVTLPFVLALLDYWPLHRTGWRLVAEKLPLLLLSAGLSVITFAVQQSGAVVSDFGDVPLGFRAANAFVSYLTYIVKLFVPARLAVFYPHPFDAIPIWKAAAAGLVLLAVSVLVFWFARGRRYLTVGWLWYIGTLVPVIGLIQAGAQARADRYCYIPYIGLFVMLAWGLAEVSEKWRYRKILLGVPAVVVLLALAAGSRLQLRHWRNNAALFEHTLRVTGNNYVMHNNYANILSDMGRLDEAVEHFYAALKLRPNSAEMHNNLANTLRKLGKTDDAIAHYEKAIELKPAFEVARYNLASILAERGFGLAKLGKFDRAVEDYNKALEIKPDFTIAHGRLGLALAALGRTEEAIKEFQNVLNDRPDDAEMHFNLGFLYEKEGKIPDAITQYLRTLQIDPNYTKARQHLETYRQVSK
jgi:Flp pilus assembly protein TadD